MVSFKCFIDILCKIVDFRQEDNFPFLKHCVYPVSYTIQFKCILQRSIHDANIWPAIIISNMRLLMGTQSSDLDSHVLSELFGSLI